MAWTQVGDSQSANGRKHPSVENGSPADGILQANDVILGVDGEPFSGDARKSLGRAITEAEKAVNKAILRPIRWRESKQAEIRIKLRSMGNYSDTTPADCPKSARILEEGCRHLAEHMPAEGFSEVERCVNALALLASGKPEYLDHVRRTARKIGPSDLKLKLHASSGMASWHWSYANLFLAEYCLATRDKHVLPAIREYSTNIAKGQSGVGAWGHGMAWHGQR